MKIEFFFETENFNGEVWEGDNPSIVNGWFEHNKHGDNVKNYCGGLMFEWQGDTAVLVDCDGAPKVPMEVIKELEGEGFNMDWAKASQ